MVRNCLWWLGAPVTLDGVHPLCLRNVYDKPTREEASHEQDMMTESGIIGSVLIATMAFGAAFTVPGGVRRRRPWACRDSNAGETFRVPGICGFRHHGLPLLPYRDLLSYIRRCKRNSTGPPLLVQLAGVWVGAGGSSMYDCCVCCVWVGAGGSSMYDCCVWVQSTVGSLSSYTLCP